MSAMTPAQQEQPKLLALLLAVPFLPRTVDAVVPFLAAGECVIMGVFALAPGKVDVHLTPQEWAIALTNFFGSIVAVAVFMSFAWHNVDATPNHLLDVPPHEILFLLLWAAADEVIFFFGHRFLHKPGVYEHCHKWHHKFKVTSYWTSYYSHPLDHQFIMWAALLTPTVMLGWGGWRCSALTIGVFCYTASATFVGSHHTVRLVSGDDSAHVASDLTSPVTDAEGDRSGHARLKQQRQGHAVFRGAVGTPHLLHHGHFNVNYGNFDLLDKLFGSHSSSK